jgi:hypothetical protein
MYDLNDIRDWPHFQRFLLRFEHNTDKSAGPYDCWPWMGARKSTGYGTTYCNPKNILAHRVAYVLGVGPIPFLLGEPLFICHFCDNPCCVNPMHLYAGNSFDNNHDRELKGRGNQRGTPGITHHRAVLTEYQVGYIRQGIESTRYLAKVYGVNPETIRRARTGERWATLPK